MVAFHCSSFRVVCLGKGGSSVCTALPWWFGRCSILPLLLAIFCEGLGGIGFTGLCSDFVWWRWFFFGWFGYFDVVQLVLV